MPSGAMRRVVAKCGEPKCDREERSGRRGRARADGRQVVERLALLFELLDDRQHQPARELTRAADGMGHYLGEREGPATIPLRPLEDFMGGLQALVELALGQLLEMGGLWPRPA